MRTIPMWAAALVLCGGFVLAAQSAAAQSAQVTLLVRQKAPPGASVSIVSPRDGATVGQDVVVRFGVKGIKLAPSTDTEAGSGHHHLLIDAQELPPAGAPIPADATHKHYGKAQTQDTIHLEPGTHTLQLDFGDAKHMQFDPPIVSKKITIHVK